MCDQSMEMVKEFPIIPYDGEVDIDMIIRIAKAASAFSCLKRFIFTNAHLSITVKRAVYRAVLLTKYDVIWI